MSVSWDLIGSALAVTEHGSFSAASRALGVTQPTIRRHVEALERELGVTLFARSSTGLTPTEQARSLASYGAEIAGLVEALVRAATSDARAVAGTIRLTCSEVLAAEVIPALLAPLLLAHPKLEIELLGSDRNQDLLHRDADIAVRMIRPTQMGLSAQRIGAVELGLFATHDYLERVGAPEDWRSLKARCRLIGEDRKTTICNALTAQGFEVRRRDFGVRSDRDLVQLAAVRAGLGIGVMQLPLARRDEKLQRVLPEITSSLDLWLVTHEDLRGQARIRVVLDHLAAALLGWMACGELLPRS